MSRRKKPTSSGERQSGDYKVGKNRPPVGTQWKPGQSGNPPGRRKGSKNRKTLVRTAERKTLTVIKGGRPRKMTVTEIGLDLLQQAVVRGDQKAFIEYLAILERYSDRDETIASMEELRAEDITIMENLIARKNRKKIIKDGDK